MQPHLFLTHTIPGWTESTAQPARSTALKPIRGVFAVTKQHNEIKAGGVGGWGGPCSSVLQTQDF